MRPSSCSQTAHNWNVLGPCAQVDGLDDHPQLYSDWFEEARLRRPSLDARRRRLTPPVHLNPKDNGMLGPCARLAGPRR